MGLAGGAPAPPSLGAFSRLVDQLALHFLAVCLQQDAGDSGSKVSETMKLGFILPKWGHC